MTPSDNPDPDLASELRQTAGREWAEEAAEDEQMTEIMRLRGRSLADLFLDLAHRSERVTVDFGGHTFSGIVTAAGSDYATIDGPGQIADVRLETGRWSLLTQPGPEPTPRSASESFLALLRQYEAGETRIRLALDGGDMVIGRITVVSVDHVEFADAENRRVYVPLELVLGVIRSSDPH